MTTPDHAIKGVTSHADMVQAIVAAHAAALALPVAENAAPVFTGDAAVYRAAKQACLQIGFIDADAQVIALAWQSMAARTGSFDATHWPAQPEDFGLRPWPRPDAFAACPKRLGLYAVLPDAAWIARMAQAGVPTLQLRFKSDDTGAVEREVKTAVKAVQGTHSLLFINDHWQIAIEAGAYGVHLGQEDMADANLQKIRAAGLRLGLSSHGCAEMLRADAHSPSYIAMGAVYATTLKRMVTPPQGPGRLQVYARLMNTYPLVAIGGIDESRLDAVLASGVGSVAVVRAIVAAEQPEQMAKRFRLRIEEALKTAI